MGRCKRCDRSSLTISSTIGFCADCIRHQSEATLPQIIELHHTARQEFGLPEEPPQREDGRLCPVCVNACRIDRGEQGYCGLREVEDGHLHHLAGTPSRGILHWYYDPLPTNCVAD